MPQLIRATDLSVATKEEVLHLLQCISVLCDHTAFKKLNLSSTNIAEEDCDLLAQLLCSGQQGRREGEGFGGWSPPFLCKNYTNSPTFSDESSAWELLV